MEKDREKEEDKKRGFLRELLDYLVTLAIVAGVVFALNSFVLINARIPSESMEPTIMKGDQIFGSRLSYRKEGPERFDIIIFEYPDDHSQYFIKRVIGLPGDTVRIAGGHVYINGSDEPLDESFIAEEQWPEPFDEELVYEVPEDSYFCLGDNRNHSRDSRYWDDHFVEREEILGKAVVRYWPVWKIRTFKYQS